MDANELLERLIAEAERAVDHNDTTPVCDVARAHLDALKRIDPVESYKDRVEELEEELRTLEREYADSYTEEYLHEYGAEEYDRGLTEGAQSRDDEIESLEDQIESLEENIENLEETRDKYYAEILNLEKEINGLNDVIDDLHKHNTYTQD